MVITMKKVYVNEDWGLGCHLCEFTCAAANSGAPDMIKAFAGGKKPVARIQIEEGDKINFAVQCRHCDAHPCVKGCIAGALSVQDGVIVCDEEKCVHCGKCLRVCPMNVEVNKESRKRKNGTECILCYECTKACPTKALH